MSENNNVDRVTAPAEPVVLPEAPVVLPGNEYWAEVRRAGDARIAEFITSCSEEFMEGLTARERLSRAQRVVLAMAAVALLLGGVFALRGTLLVVVWVMVLVYGLTVLHRVLIVRDSMSSRPFVGVSDADARAIPDDLLPTYTVLVPVYREPEVVQELVRNLAALEYPHDRLEILLLTEVDDDETREAAAGLTARIEATGLPLTVLTVPDGTPRTKPRALNYGLLMSSGALVTVYDAEDRPDPLQLRKAAAVLAATGPEVACLQARLEFYGWNHNLLSRWFTAEYLTWFVSYLPGIARRGIVPLGGTSNHFRREVLEGLGGWDAHNVTEDADLGLRMQRHGYRVLLLDSVTLEEVNNDVINWVKQRSRWMKGYLQTALVHLRRPRELTAQLGWRGLAHLCLFVLGTPLLAIANLVFWGMWAAWVITGSTTIERLFPPPLYYVALFVWAFGNFLIWYLNLVTLLSLRRVSLVGSALLWPLYWVLMSVAAFRAVVQLVIDPYHWEKTTHGLGRGEGDDEEVVALP